MASRVPIDVESLQLALPFGPLPDLPAASPASGSQPPAGTTPPLVAGTSATDALKPPGLVATSGAVTAAAPELPAGHTLP